MLSEQALLALSATYKPMCFLKIIPFDWDSKNFRLKPPSNWKMQIHKLHLINIWTHVIFLSISFEIHQNALFMKPSSFMLHIIWLGSFVCAALYSIFNFTCRYELANFVNELIRVIRDDCIEADEVLEIDWCARFLCSFLVGGYSFGLFATITFYKDPFSSRYLYRLFYNSTSDASYSSLFAFGVWQFLNCLTFWFTLLFDAATIMIYLFGTVTWFKTARCKISEEDSCKPNELFQIYKRLKLLNNHFNCCYRDFAFPAFQALMVLMPVICYHSIIRFHDHLDLILVFCLFSVSSSSTAFLMGAWPVAAELNTKSMEFLKSLKSFPNISKKEVKAMRSIRIECGNFPYVQRYTTYKILGFILYGTGKSLLLIREE